MTWKRKNLRQKVTKKTRAQLKQPLHRYFDQGDNQEAKRILVKKMKNNIQSKLISGYQTAARCFVCAGQYFFPWQAS